MTARRSSFRSTVRIFQVEAAGRKRSDEAAGEAVARAGRIEDFFEKISGNDKVLILAEEHGAVFAALDDQRVRPHGEDLLAARFRLRFAREQSRFAVIDQQEVPVLECLRATRHGSR